MAKTRKSQDGHVLRTGEYERRRGGFEFKFLDASGVRCSISAPTLTELREREKEVQRAQVDGVSVSAGRQTMAAYYEIWISQKRGMKQRTSAHYKYIYEQYIHDHFGDKSINSIKFSDIRSYYGGLLDDGLSVETVRTVHGVLVQIFALAERDDLIRRNPARGAFADLARGQRPEQRHALTPAEQARFLDVIKNTVWAELFEIAIRTGMRAGELAGLTWEDVDMEAGVIHVRHNVTIFSDEGHIVRRCTTPKTASGSRDIPMADDVMALFERQRVRGKTCSATIDGVTGFVFANRYGGVLTKDLMNRALYRLTAAANETAMPGDVLLPQMSCHCFRRTYATNAVRAGVQMPVLMRLLGHTDPATTLQYYINVHNDMRDIADEAITSYINDVVKMAKKSG